MSDTKKTISADGIELFTELEIAEAWNKAIPDGSLGQQFLRALGVKHPSVVEYEARERERAAYLKGEESGANSIVGMLSPDVSAAYPALTDPRVPVTPKGRTVALSGGRTATSFIKGDWWLRIDGVGISPRHFPCDMWRDGIHDYAHTPADARDLADLVESPEAPSTDIPETTP